MQANWDPEANVHMLRWEEGDILYEIIHAYDNEVEYNASLLIKIAENPDIVARDSEDDQTTTGIPGFPLGSIVAGLAIVILLQYLNHSRRG